MTQETSDGDDARPDADDARDALVRGIAEHYRQMATVVPPLTIGLPKFDVPRIEFPQLDLPGSVTAELAAATERWRVAMRPYAEIGQQLRKRYAEMMAPMAKFADPLRRLQVIDAQCGRLESLGWLPHANSPLNFVAEDIEDASATDWAIHEYYHDNWAQLGSALIADVADCDLDGEAKAAFAEAVTAHGAGLYRCAPRLLFPEVERVSRKEIHGGALDKMASQQRLVEAIGGLTPAEMSSTGVAGLRFYRKLTEHLYMHMKDEAAVALAIADPVPNRHAALHGIVSYASPKSSINAILAADYLLRAISTIKHLRAADPSEMPDAA